MWRTIRKGLWSRKRRLVSTGIAVILGVAFLVATLATGDTMRGGFDTLFEEANDGTAVLVRNATEIGSGDVSERGTLDAALGERLRSVDGVDAVAPVIEASGQIVGADGEPLGGGGPPTIAGNWIDDDALNPYQLEEGRAPRPTSGDVYEVVIDKGSAENGDLTFGDRTVVRTPEPVQVVIAGIATFGDADSLGPTTYAAFDEASARQLFGEPGTVSDFRIAADDGVRQDELRSAVDEVLPANAEAITGAELTDEQLADINSDFLGMFETIMLAFAGIALVVATFSIHNTFSILVAQRTRESALMRAIGASRRQILTGVVIEALAVGVIASAIGLAVGYGMAGGLNALMGGFGLDLPGSVLLQTDTIVVASLVGVVVTLFASLVPAIKASRVAPLEALRDAAVDGTSVSKTRAVAGSLATAAGIATVVTATGNADAPMAQAGLGALATLVGAVILGPVVARPAAGILGFALAVFRGQTGKLARRNAMRNPRRTAGSASALMVGTAVVALFTSFGASISASVQDTVDRSFGGDLIVESDNWSGTGLSPRFAQDVDQLPEVSDAVGLAYGVAEYDGSGVSPTVGDTGRLGEILDLDVSSGSLADVGRDGVAVSEQYAEDHGLDTGSVMPMRFADGTTEELTVAAVYRSRDLVGDVVVGDRLWNAHAAHRSDTMVLIDLADGVSEDTGAAAVDRVADRYSAPDAQTRAEYIAAIGDEVDQMLFFVYGLLGVAILIALMGIANTLALSIHERTRELGLLRAVGQTRSQVRAAIRWESVIVAVFGTIGGLALGTFLGWGMMRAVAEEQGFGVFTVPVTSLAVVLGLAAVAGVVAALRPARRAARLDVLQAITTE